ncbi:hypothetical protein [Flavobacterium silvaticum]|uniref:DUF4595 domain-containing protein n=1 Tax=Flavobacterium silvaticum TaxID=1852020 RepID=A0A972FMC2_9FLAO|nr:hypothetical protein [Flavobacterium silvaticum]NMH27850.1 hypothetical protein [Flavobacterium silvaticum]
MKQFFSVFIALLFIVSCSSDEASPVLSTEGTKLLSIHNTLAYGAYNVDYTYDGNFLKTNTVTNYPSITYSYNGNLIVSANTSQITQLFTYDSQERLIKTENTAPDGYQYEEYTYPDAQTILVKQYWEGNLVRKQTIHMENNEIASFENEILTDTEWVYSSYSFTYDNKNNPRAQWPGFDKIFMSYGLRSSVWGRYHNPTSAVETTPGESTPGSAWYNITYNSQDFPIHVEYVDEDGIPFGTVQDYFYQGN